MPELPEVETMVRILRPALLGRTILSADLLWARTLAASTPRKFKQQISGQKIIAISRRAKYFQVRLTDYELVIHLRMSGCLLTAPGGYEPAKHDRLILNLSGGACFVFNDPRKFGRVWLVKDARELFSDLGPEPLSDEFTPDWLFNALHARRRQLKPLLLDQKFIAGLGNIYTDEALHLAKLHPLTPSSALTRPQALLLWQAIRDILQEGIRRNGASIDWVFRGGDFQNHFRVYGRTGAACPVCGDTVERIVTGQRGTHFCPTCQEFPPN
jgi:formamidopyrimidine-DNA glycosylase